MWFFFVVTAYHFVYFGTKINGSMALNGSMAIRISSLEKCSFQNRSNLK